MIPESEWKWFGYPMHFICGRKCIFHLGTQVGQYVISTVAEYYDYEGKRQPVGLNRWGETYVFRITGTQECGCPQPAGNEIDGLGYGEHDSCTVMNDGHLAMCRKYAQMTETG